MTQTTGSIWGGAAKVEISVAGAVWTNISGHSQKVSPSGGERQVGEAYTFDGEGPIVKVGKKNTRELRVDIIYTEATIDAFELARGQFDTTGGGTMFVRWSPSGGTGGTKLYTTDSGFVEKVQYPEVDSEMTGPVKTYFVVRHSSITVSTIAT